MKKTILVAAAALILTACATTAPTSGVQRNCMSIDLELFLLSSNIDPSNIVLKNRHQSGASNIKTTVA